MSDHRPTSGRFAVVPARAIDDRRLQPAGLRVLAALCTYADRDGWCWPSAATVGARLGVSRQAVVRQRQLLVELGYLEVSRRRRDDGAERSALLRVIYDAELPADADRLRAQPDVAPAQPHVAAPATPDVAAPATPDVAPLERPKRTTQANAAAARASARDAGGSGTPADLPEVLAILRAAPGLDVSAEAVRSAIAAHPDGDAAQAAHLVASWAAEPGLRCRSAARLLHSALAKPASSERSRPGRDDAYQATRRRRAEALRSVTGLDRADGAATVTVTAVDQDSR